jgi:hypothetical protein
LLFLFPETRRRQSLHLWSKFINNRQQKFHLLSKRYRKGLFKRSHVGPTSLLDETCWPRLNTMLDDVSLSLNLLKIFIQHRATLLAQQCCTML